MTQDKKILPGYPIRITGAVFFSESGNLLSFIRYPEISGFRQNRSVIPHQSEYNRPCHRR